MTKPDYDCSRVVEIENEPRHHLVIANEFVRAFAVEIAPGARTLCHRHPSDYLLYVALGSEIISAARDEKPKRLNYRDGECEMSAAGLIHVVENLGDTPFRNVVVELLPKAGALPRGGDPQKISGAIVSRKVLDDARAAIFEIEIEPGAEVAVSGPAVVASPYGNELILRDIAVQHDSICDLAWLASGTQTCLVGSRTDVLRAVVFQIGMTDDHQG
jgi:quercetin dioxygenase-like cupin family protein